MEFRGFGYHTGVSVSAYAAGCAEELARGGRYLSGPNAEPATGITLFPESLARVAPQAPRKPRLFVASGQQGAAALRDAGFATVAQLGAVEDIETEARRLLCSHILRNGVAVALPALQTEKK